jgi:hypothetical protein
VIETLALVVVVLAGVYFIALGVASILLPAQATRFLLGFADSSLKHFAELLLRILVGGAFVAYAHRMLFQGAFSLFGWVLIATTACLLLIPWRWHHQFAQQAVPAATRHIKLIGFGSLALGGLVMAAVVRGSAA